ncbi:hypothetical protein MTO96_037138 [Rhipicephalus appendiculatus]
MARRPGYRLLLAQTLLSPLAVFDPPVDVLCGRVTHYLLVAVGLVLGLVYHSAGIDGCGFDRIPVIAYVLYRLGQFYPFRRTGVLVAAGPACVY